MTLPEDVVDEMGYALHQAQMGGKSRLAKPLAGFSGASVFEIVSKDMGETYRGIYTVKFAKAIAVLHVFHKKSKHGIETPKQELELIHHRLAIAEQQYKEWLQEEKYEKKAKTTNC